MSALVALRFLKALPFKWVLDSGVMTDVTIAFAVLVELLIAARKFRRRDALQGDNCHSRRENPPFPTNEATSPCPDKPVPLWCRSNKQCDKMKCNAHACTCSFLLRCSDILLLDEMH